MENAVVVFIGVCFFIAALFVGVKANTKPQAAPRPTPKKIKVTADKNAPSGTLWIMGQPSQVKQRPAVVRILAALDSQPKSINTIAEEAGTTLQATRAWLSELAKTNRAVRASRGMYKAKSSIVAAS